MSYVLVVMSAKNKIYFDAAILGGGVSGLTCAYELSKAGKKVIVLEKSDVLGGALRSVERNGYFIEGFYHHIFQGDDAFFGILRELGIFDEILWAYPKTSFYLSGTFHNLTKPTDLFGFSMLGISDKIAFFRLMISLKTAGNISKLDDLSAMEWIMLKGNRYVYDRLFRPMLESKYGNNVSSISAAWLVERMRLRANRGLRGEYLGYVNGGFHIFIERIASEIERMGGVVRTSAEVKKIESSGKKAKCVLYTGGCVDVGAIYCTIDPHKIAKIIDFPKDFLSHLNDFEYQGALCIVLGLKRKLTDYYWTNVMDSGLPFGAIVEHTNFQDFSKYNEHLIYLASYPDKKSKLWTMDMGSVFSNYFAGLEKMFPDICRGDVAWWEVFRDEYAGPIYRVGSLSKILAEETPFSNVFIGGMFNSYPERSIELSVRKGKECAAKVLDVLDLAD